MILTINGSPIPWTAPRLGRYTTYSPISKEKQVHRAFIKNQYTGKLITVPIHLKFVFYMPIPKSLKKRVKPGDCHDKRPDLTNLQKLAEDYLIGTVIKDDNQTCRITAEKIYSENPRTEIEVLICLRDNHVDKEKHLLP